MTRTTTTTPKKTAVPVTPTADIACYGLSTIFTKAFDWTARLKMPANHIRVLDFIVRMCGRSGQVTCCHEFIAARFNISVKTVGRAVANIEARQFVTVRRRYKTANHYTVHPDIVAIAWPPLERGQALPRDLHPSVSGNVSDMRNRHVHGRYTDLSSACAGTREETLSAARGSDANEAAQERTAIMDEIVAIRIQLHQLDPTHPQIQSVAAYTGPTSRLGKKSTPELRTELENNRKVLENAKKPKSAPVSQPGKNIAAQVAERERETYTGCGEAWFTAWTSLDEAEQVKWREQAEAQMWNDPEWEKFCRRQPDPLEQELARRRKTRELFRAEWENLHSQDVAANDAADAAASPDTDPAGSTPSAEADHRPGTVEATGNQVTPADADPDADPPPTGPKRHRRQHRTRRPATATTPPDRGKTSHQPASQTPGQDVENASTGILRGQPASQQPGNVLLFRRPAPVGPFSDESLSLTTSADERPPTRGPDDG